MSAGSTFTLFRNRYAPSSSAGDIIFGKLIAGDFAAHPTVTRSRWFRRDLQVHTLELSQNIFQE